MNPKAKIGSILCLLLIYMIVPECEAVKYKSRLLKKKEAEGTKYVKSAAELQLHIDDLASVFTGVIEQTADHVITASTEMKIKQHALLWKINGIPTAYRALFHNDPAVAILDTWAFSMQMVNYFKQGAGKEDFGKWHKIAHKSSQRLEAKLTQLVASGLPDGNVKPLREDFWSWVMEHPIARDFIYRDTVIPILGEIIGDQELDTLQTVGGLAVGIEEIADLFAVHLNLLTKQARWQVELFLLETFKNYDAQEAVSTIVELAKSLNQISPVIEQFPEFIAHEREAFLGVLQAERATILDSIEEQRIVTLSEIESSSNQFLKTSMDQSKQLIDHLFIRALQLLAASMLCAVIIVVLIFRLKGTWKSKID